MKKVLIVFAVFLFINFAAPAGANLILTPSPPDVYDLEHAFYYTWGLDAGLINAFAGSTAVVGINLNFHGIYNSTYYGLQMDPSNLFVWLLDEVAPGVSVYPDDGGGYPAGPGVNFDNFAAQFPLTPIGGVHLVTYETPDSTSLPDIPYDTPVDITYSFTADQVATFWAYLANNNSVGLGFDPDCRYFNEKITLELVPEPATILLLSTGLIGLAGIGRKKFFKKS